MFDQLSREEKLRLVRFVCSFAWADLEIADAERRFVHTLVVKLNLDEEAMVQARAWLKTPPDPEDIDPLEVPREHREIFLATARAIIASDGLVDDAEIESYLLFEQLVR